MSNQAHFAKPFLTTGKNTSTNLFSICNNHTPALTTMRLSLKPPVIRDSNPFGESKNINNTIRPCVGMAYIMLHVRDFFAEAGDQWRIQDLSHGGGGGGDLD